MGKKTEKEPTEAEDGAAITSEPKPEQASVTPSSALVAYDPALPSDNQNIPYFIVNVIPGVPAGLEVLFHTRSLTVKQFFEFFETCVNSPLKYVVEDSFGQRLFMSADFKIPLCYPFLRSFQVQLLNFAGHQVLGFYGHPGCTEREAHVRITYGLGEELLGTCVQLWTCCTPVYHVLNPSGQIEFIIVGPDGAACIGACGSADFGVFLPDRLTEVGRLCKYTIAGFCTRYDLLGTFVINYPGDLDTKSKALLLGTTMLLDFQYYGKKGQSRYAGSRRVFWASEVFALAGITFGLWNLYRLLILHENQ